MKINAKDIFNKLKIIDIKYNSSSTIEALLYSKLAILEASGWVEEIVDNIVLNYSKKYTCAYYKYIEDKIVAKVYGVHYQNDFRVLLSQIIGILKFERIEKKIDSIKKAKFEFALNSLNRYRNEEAHKATNIQRYIDAPSRIISLMQDVLIGLNEFKRELNKIRYK